MAQRANKCSDLGGIVDGGQVLFGFNPSEKHRRVRLWSESGLHWQHHHHHHNHNHNDFHLTSRKSCKWTRWQCQSCCQHPSVQRTGCFPKLSHDYNQFTMMMTSWQRDIDYAFLKITLLTSVWRTVRAVGNSSSVFEGSTSPIDPSASTTFIL